MSDEHFNVVKIFGGHLVEKNVLKKYPIVINAGVHQGQEMFDLMNLFEDVEIHAIEASRLCYDRALNHFKNYKNINFLIDYLASLLQNDYE